MKKAVLIAAMNDFAGQVDLTQVTISPLVAPPLSILALGSYLTTHGVPVELIDVHMDFGFGLDQAAEQLVFQRLARYLQDQAAEIAWIGCSQLSNSGSGVRLAAAIHAALPQIPLVLGGYFASAMYASLLEQYPFLTAIVRGDGEAAALAISRHVAAGQAWPAAEIPNLAWWDGDQVRTTPVQPMALADLPPLDFRLLRHPAHYQIIELLTSRGCPFACTYCLEATMRPYAVHSPAWVAQQLTHLEATLPQQRVFIYDPVFGLGRQRTRQMCEVLRERHFTYAVESRADVLDPALFPALREAGVELIYLGIESASPATLVRMNKVRSLDRARRYVRSARAVLQAAFENGVTLLPGFMLGFPGDTEADYQATLDLVREAGRLHDQVAGRTGAGAGFVPLVFISRVYAGSPLAASLAECPDVVLGPAELPGEWPVLSPSPGLELAVAQRYQGAVMREGRFTPLALERLGHYALFSVEALLTAHPELIDEHGVVTFGDSLQRFPQDYRPELALRHYGRTADG
ncbi:MAG: B12-binding domain-containing radical SAM protein [Chloroflexi bacterium]|nr:B12-binding domain-containing radical SAM protein [Chloroflexota bacterium]